MAHLLPVIGQDVKILGTLDVIPGFLQGMSVHDCKPGIAGNGSMPVPDKAVCSLCYVVQQHGKVGINLIFLFRLCLFLHQCIEVGKNREVLRFQLGNIRVPCDVKLLVQLHQTFF